MSKLEKTYYKNDDKLFLHHSPKVLFDKLQKKIKLKDIKKFLSTQRNYTLYKQSTAKNVRNAYKIFTIDQLWEMDLISIPSLSKFNSGIIHSLVCIDVFSRFAFVRTLQSKQPREVVKCLMNIFKTSNRQPHTIQSDAGKEFTGKEMQLFLKNRNIEFRVPRTTLPAKCAVVERFNRTLKQKIGRLLEWKKVMHKSNEKRYIDDLQDIVDDYNKTIHSSIKIAPQKVNKTNSAALYEKIRTHWTSIDPVSPKLRQGSYVRVKRKRDLFEKEAAKPVWSNEIFTITRAIPRHPYPVYEIKDLKGHIIDGKLYEREIQKIRLPTDTPIEVIKKPNVFDKTMQAKTLDGKIRTFNYDKEKNERKQNNYADILSLLI